MSPAALARVPPPPCRPQRLPPVVSVMTATPVGGGASRELSTCPPGGGGAMLGAFSWACRPPECLSGTMSAQTFCWLSVRQPSCRAPGRQGLVAPDQVTPGATGSLTSVDHVEAGVAAARGTRPGGRAGLPPTRGDTPAPRKRSERLLLEIPQGCIGLGDLNTPPVWPFVGFFSLK